MRHLDYLPKYSYDYALNIKCYTISFGNICLGFFLYNMEDIAFAIKVPKHGYTKMLDKMTGALTMFGNVYKNILFMH